MELPPMEPRSILQLLPEDETSDSSTDETSGVEDYGERKEVKEVNEEKLDAAEACSPVERTKPWKALYMKVSWIGKGKKKGQEVDELNKAERGDRDEDGSLDTPPYAESSAAAQKRHTEGTEPPHLDQNYAYDYDEEEIEEDDDARNARILEQRNLARSLVQDAKYNCFIHKVHPGLRDALSAKHYEPVLLSIGPYHHGKAPVQDMEKHKIHYMEILLLRLKKKDPHRLKEKDTHRRKEKDTRGLEEDTARYEEPLKDEHGEQLILDCYRDTHIMMGDSFGKCLLHDGLFMLELFRRNLNPGGYADSSDDMLFNIRWMKPRLARDMLLFENQMPLPVLRALFVLTEHIDDEGYFIQLMLRFFEFNGKQIPFSVDPGKLSRIPHLLGLVYEALVRTEANKYFEPMKPRKVPKRERTSFKMMIWSVLVKLIEEFLVPKTSPQPKNEWKSFEFIRTAVALEEVGVTFVKADDSALFHDIVYRDGVLSIPRLVIDDNTESFFRNVVAYEQYSKNNSLHRVVDYLQVMDCLINTSKDVELLRHHGIIDNRIGDDVKVSTMFNRLCSDVYFDQKKFFYAPMFEDVNKFGKDRRNVWMAKLKNEYFGSPWSVISFIAALMLLLLTAVQTGYTVASYYK